MLLTAHKLASINLWALFSAFSLHTNEIQCTAETVGRQLANAKIETDRDSQAETEREATTLGQKPKLKNSLQHIFRNYYDRRTEKSKYFRTRTPRLYDEAQYTICPSFSYTYHRKEIHSLDYTPNVFIFMNQLHGHNIRLFASQVLRCLSLHVSVSFWAHRTYL